MSSPSVPPSSRELPDMEPLSQGGLLDGMLLGPALAQVWGALPSELTISKLLGDASTRSYYRAQSPFVHPRSLIVMRMPDGQTPSALGLPELPFVNVQRHLQTLQIPVPSIYLDASEQGFLLLEDLGDELFETRLRERPTSLRASYEQAIDLLATLHERAAPNTDCIAYTRAFDRKLLRWELDHFREWGLEAIDISLAEHERTLLDRQFDQLVDALLRLPQGFTHRDYQSRNLIWRAGRELTVIDFQDALLGPLGYDLAALLCDSYVELGEPLQLALLERYAEHRKLAPDALISAFRLVSVQRKFKDAGRFVFIDQVRGNPRFLPWYGRSVRYAARALAALPQYAELHALLAEKLAGYPDAVGSPAARTGSRSGQTRPA